MKINNKILAGVFAILLIVLAYQKLIRKNTPRSFKETLVNIDTSNLDRMILKNGGVSTTLEKLAGQWMVSASDGKKYPATKTSVKPLLDAASGLKVQQLISRSNDKLASYELDDASAKKLEYYDGNKMVSALYVGRFNFDQARRSAKTYVREDASSDIYSVDGFLAMSFDRKPDDFRDSALFRNFKASEIDKISYRSSEDGFELSKDPNTSDWFNNEGIRIDSAQLASYLSALKSVRGSEFVSMDSNEGQNLGELIYSTGDQLMAQVSLGILNDTSFVVSNTQIPSQSFRSDSAGIFKTVWLDLLDSRPKN